MRHCAKGPQEGFVRVVTSSEDSAKDSDVLSAAVDPCSEGTLLIDPSILRTNSCGEVSLAQKT